MAINVNWDEGAVIKGLLASATGRAQRQRELEQQAQQDDRYLLGLAENQRQFDLGQQQRADEGAAQRGLQREQMATAAYRDMAGEAQRMAALQEQNQFNLLRDQQDFGQQLYANEQEQMFDLQSASSDQIGQQAETMLSEYRKQKLDPVGSRELRRLQAEWRALQSGLGNTIRPQAFNDLASQWFDKFQQANLDQYVDEPPSPDDLWGQQTRTDEFGNVFGLDRSGNFRKLRDAPPKPLTPEEIAANTFELPTGGSIFVNPNTGKETLIPPPKPEEAKAEPNEPVMSARDSIALDKHIYDIAKMEWEAQYGNQYDKDGNPIEPKVSFPKYFDENEERLVAKFNRRKGDPDESSLVPSELQPPDLNMPSTDGGWYQGGELPAEEEAAAEPEEDAREIITNAAGERAYVNPDGTVEMIP
jgi:hypothetical protein